jgi:hypothetical protein
MAFLTRHCSPPRWCVDPLQDRLVTLILDDAVYIATSGASGAIFKMRDLVCLQDEIGCRDKQMTDRLLQALSTIRLQADRQTYTAALQLVELLCGALGGPVSARSARQSSDDQSAAGAEAGFPRPAH